MTMFPRRGAPQGARPPRRKLGRFLSVALVAALVGPIPLLPQPAAAQSAMKPIIWIANSSEGTISLLDTRTGNELGRYRTGTGFASPSRTTVDRFGNVWVANRASGTAVKYNHPDNCIPGSRSGQTSTGSTALPYGDDDCFVVEVFVGSGARGVAVDRNNDVWMGTYTASPNVIKKFRGSDGVLLDQMTMPFGSYGAVIDREGFFWSAHNNGRVTRVDIRDPASATYGDMMTIQTPRQSYGITCDQFGHIWVTDLTGSPPQVHKIDASSGAILGSFAHGQNNAQGVAVDGNGDVWIAGSLVGNTVARLDNDGNQLGVIQVGSGPTGVAVDVDGKVWATNINSSDASRIDPGPPPPGVEDGRFPVGLGPYNYSDMTGFVLHNCTLPPDDGFDPCLDDPPVSPRPPDLDDLVPPELPAIDHPPVGPIPITIDPPDLPGIPVGPIFSDLQQLLEDLLGFRLTPPGGAAGQGDPGSAGDDGREPAPGDPGREASSLCGPPVVACVAVGLAVRANTAPPLRLDLARSAAAAQVASEDPDGGGGFATGSSDTAVARADILPTFGAGVLESRCHAEARGPGIGVARGEATAERFAIDLRPEGIPLHARGEILREQGATPPGANDATITQLEVNGTTILDERATPNQVIALPGGIEVTLNEQRVTAHPQDPSCRVYSGNALRITVADPTSGAPLAHVIVSHVATNVC